MFRHNHKNLKRKFLPKHLDEKVAEFLKKLGVKLDKLNKTQSDF